MYPLRQRLLLVAGWLVAAISAGLVASGAVAVAGGQVLDRPLRPLTAAEVAALPVPTVEVSEPIEPHASGGSPEDSDTSTQGTGNIAGDQTESSGTEGSAASEDEEPLALDAFPEPQRPSVRVVVVDGGRASFAANEDSIVLLWATARPGHTASTRVVDDEIRVTFSSDRDVWLVEAALEEGEIVIRTEVLPFA